MYKGILNFDLSSWTFAEYAIALSILFVIMAMAMSITITLINWIADIRMILTLTSMQLNSLKIGDQVKLKELISIREEISKKWKVNSLIINTTPAIFLFRLVTIFKYGWLSPKTKIIGHHAWSKDLECNNLDSQPASKIA